MPGPGCVPTPGGPGPRGRGAGPEGFLVWGGAWSRGEAWSGRVAGGDPPPLRRLLLRAVRILLECILVYFSFANEKLLNWIEMLWYVENFYKCGILQCNFHLNNLVHWDLIWTWNKCCCTIHHISYIHIHHNIEYLAELFVSILISH